MARCGCGSVRCSEVRPCISAGDGIVYDPGTGVISADVACEQVRPCLSAGDGAAYDPDTGVISARPSDDDGNTLEFGDDGGLYVPGGAGVEVGCGLAGTGADDDPLAVAVAEWDFDGCTVDEAAGRVFCDGDGVLRSEPRSQGTYVQDTVNTMYDETPVPAGSPGTLVETRQLEIVNPDPCRPAFVICEVEVDVDFLLPAGSGASYGILTDEMYYTANTGSTTIVDAHVQTTKVYHRELAPGETLMEPLEIIMGRGTGGASWNRLQTFMRAFIMNF